MSVKSAVKQGLLLLHKHKKTAPDIFIFTLPRAGSTLLSEILNTTPQVKTCGEPFALNTENKLVLYQYFNASFLQERYADVSAEEFLQFKSYFKNLSSGKLWNGYNWADLKTKYHNFLTNRTVFKTHKVSYFFEDILNEFPDDKGVYLLRHPVSHGLSRIRNNWHPYIEQFEKAEKIAPFLTNQQKISIENVKKGGSKIAKFTLSWCLENFTFLYALHNNTLPKNCFYIKYENLVNNTEVELKKLCNNLNIRYLQDMQNLIKRPSKGIIHSTKDVEQNIIAGNTNELTNRWKTEISASEKDEISQILSAFEVESIYKV